MARYLLCAALAACLLSAGMARAEVLREDFNTGVDKSAYANETTVTLASGQWLMKAVASNTSNGVTAVKFNSGGYIIAPAVDRPARVAFKYRSGGSNKPVAVTASADGGETWTPVGDFVIKSSSSSYSSVSFKMESEDANVRVRITCENNVYVDDVEITYDVQPEVNPLDTITVPTLLTSAASLGFNNVRLGESRDRTVRLTGTRLRPEAGTLLLSTDDEAFLISADGGQTFATTCHVGYAEATLDTTFTIRFTPSALRSYASRLNVEGGDATASIDLRGAGSETGTQEFYLAPDGDDTADGTIDHPWLNLQQAVDKAAPGDVIIMRGGRYRPTMRKDGSKLTIRITSSGTAEQPITIRAYDGEQPVIDFEQQLLDCGRDRSKVGDRGILLTGNYWHLYGLHITHAADNGIKLEGSHNRIERCEFSYNLDTGLQLGFGHNFADSGHGSKNDGSWCAYNDIVDCDSHHNCDYDSNYGSDADGFACKMHNGKGNRFIRCRAWRNGDDAWDLYETDYDVVLVECWAWESAKAEDHTWVYDYFDRGPSFSGNGNGIKLGGNGTGGSSTGIHYCYNCIAFGCNKTSSVKGFDQNNHKGGNRLYGCLAFDCGYDFMFEDCAATSEFYNNVCLGRQEIGAGTESHNAIGTAVKKGWANHLVTGVTRDDFVSLDEEDALAPRGTDGSMPTRFGRLATTSKLIDAGNASVGTIPFTDEFPFLAQPVSGAGRDIGPYELNQGGPSAVQALLTHTPRASLSIRGGRGDGEQIVRFSVDHAGTATVSITTAAGALVHTVFRGTADSGIDYFYPIDTRRLAAGVYICRLATPTGSKAVKFVVR